jgi:hypothetical protein
MLPLYYLTLLTPSSAPLTYYLKQDLVELETVKTEEMYEQMDNILTSLTPKNFHQSMKVVSAFTIDTEDKLQGIIDSIYERVILNPTSAEVYAKVCNQLKGVCMHLYKSPCVYLCLPVTNSCFIVFNTILPTLRATYTECTKH